MTYTKPLVTLLDTTTEMAACRPCIQVGALSVRRTPQVNSDGTQVGAPCPTAPTPGTPEIGGVQQPGPIDTKSILDSQGIADTYHADVLGNDVSVVI